MPLFSILFIIFSYLQSCGLENTIESISKPSQNLCTNLYQFTSSHLHLYKAIACGVSVKDSSYDILKVVSLWHLIIVSAGHFKIILWLLKPLEAKARWIPHVGLILFTLSSGAQPPVLRAYVDHIMRLVSLRWKLWIPSEYGTLYSSCLILLLLPSWSHSWSFLLSWLCGILILILQRYSFFVQALGLSIGVFPVVCLFSTPHPFSFLFNIIFAPPLSFLLFPLCLLMIIFPFLHPLADFFVNSLLFLLTQSAGSHEYSLSSFNRLSHHSLFYAWIYVLCLQALALFMRQKNKKIHCLTTPPSQLKK